MQSIRYRGRARHSDQERAEIVAAYEASGLSQAEYCGDVGISVATLANWRRREGRPVLRGNAPLEGGRFMEVTPMVTSLTRPEQVRIEITAGPVRLALPMGVSASWIAELVRGLQCGG